MPSDLAKRFDWQTSGKESHPIHSIHPYFAKFEAALPRKLILSMTSEKDTVLDPFSGCGTTLVEASLLNRNAVGIDANPLGCLLARVKTRPISDESLGAFGPLLDDLDRDISAYYGQASLFESAEPALTHSLPEFYNRDYWFTEHALHELAIIKAHVLTISDTDLRELGLVAFSRVIVFASNQQTESRYKRVVKNRRAKDVFNEFRKTLLSMRTAVRDYTVRRATVSVRVFNRDSRDIDFIKPDSIDLIVTSPPYLNAWDYALYHRFRFFWLDMDIPGYEQVEIGKHLRALEGRSKTDEVERYSHDMELCLQGFARVLKGDKFCCIVNANSIVQKRFVDTNEIIIQQAGKHGLQIVDVLDRVVFGPHHGMHAALNTKRIQVETGPSVAENGGTAKKEQILVFRKG